MRVAPINCSYTKQNRAHGFRGLWAKTTSKSDFDDVLGVLKVRQTSYYHPFIDETKEQIQKVLDENNYANINEDGQPPKYLINECKQVVRLPFTEENFNIYRKADSNTYLSKKLKFVNEAVKDKYIDNSYGINQKSAVNQSVNLKIMAKQSS